MLGGIRRKRLPEFADGTRPISLSANGRFHPYATNQRFDPNNNPLVRMIGTV
jgi:hypothetical protein